MRPLRIDVSVDLVCPWCLIGLRHLQAARAALAASAPEQALELRWHGVQLLPDVPAQGHPFLPFYRQRLGGDAAVRQRQDQVTAAARAAGAIINYERIAVMPNTADAHRVLQLAGGLGPDCQERLLERLLCAYFERGEDLSQPAVLMRHGAACGIDPGELAGVLHGARQPWQAAIPGQGAHGVPYFVVDGRLALSGAQPAAALLAAIEQALRHQMAVEA